MEHIIIDEGKMLSDSTMIDTEWDEINVGFFEQDVIDLTKNNCVMKGFSLQKNGFQTKRTPSRILSSLRSPYEIEL